MIHLNFYQCDKRDRLLDRLSESLARNGSFTETVRVTSRWIVLVTTTTEARTPSPQDVHRTGRLVRPVVRRAKRSLTQSTISLHNPADVLQHSAMEPGPNKSRDFNGVLACVMLRFASHHNRTASLPGSVSIFDYCVVVTVFAGHGDELHRTQ